MQQLTSAISYTVNPARAGMIRRIEEGSPMLIRKPRASGDDPAMTRLGEYWLR